VIRALLVLACVAFVALLLLGMRLGWRHRAERQAFLPGLPPVPDDLGAAQLTLRGVYVGTTFATSWQDRVVHAGLGLPAEATLTLHADGLLIDRAGGEPIFVPRASIVAARLAPGLAGVVVGEGGLLVVRWRLGESELDTGLRADDKTSYPQWVQAINGKVTV
jgi:hypothetical protein